MQQFERLRTIRKELKLSQKEFADSLGLKQGSYSDIERGKTKGISDSILKLISNIYNINIDYILTGDGYMFNEDNTKGAKTINVDFKTEEYQPILDIRVCAGQGIGLFGDENNILSWVNIPEFKGCKGIMVFGESMYDKYAPGDVVFIREIQDSRNIENGQPYVVITNEDRLLKLIYHEWGQNFVTLVSYNATLNPDGRRTYPDMNVATEDILFIYKVVGKISRNQL